MDSNTYVNTNSGKIPFSVGYMAQALLSLGMTNDEAYNDAYEISKIVDDRDTNVFNAEEIMNLAITWYNSREPEYSFYSKRLVFLKDSFKKFKPMVILLGGVTGIGKSTIASFLGSNFRINSILGTDLIREVLRVTISSSLMPTLHTSSYKAHRTLDTSFLPATSRSVLGFEEQARTVIVGVESAIEQAIQDEEILIIEGVHLIPGILKKKFIDNEAVHFFMLTLQNEEAHRSRLTSRETKTKSRSENYLKYMRNIRKIQDYLVEQAQHNEIEIIDIEDDEKALLDIINSVWEWKLKNINDNLI